MQKALQEQQELLLAKAEEHARQQVTSPPPIVREGEFFVKDLLVRIHFIIEMIWWNGLAPCESEFPFPGSLISTFLIRGHLQLK